MKNYVEYFDVLLIKLDRILRLKLGSPNQFVFQNFLEAAMEVGFVYNSGEMTERQLIFEELEAKRPTVSYVDLVGKNNF